MKRIAENNGYQIYFDCSAQIYTVFKDNKIILTNKYKYSDVKCYID